MPLAETAELAVRLSLDDRLSPAISRAQGKLRGLGSAAKTVGKGIAIGVGVGATAGIVVLTDALHTGIEALKQDAVVGAQTAAVIKSTGGAAGVTAGQITALADALSKQDGIQDNVVQTAENMLLTFTKVGKDIFPRVTAAALDMSAALGTDSQQAAIQLGKALQDPSKGIARLTRLGVTFTDQQKKQIETLLKHGKVQQAQAIILGAVEQKYQGVAKAQADADPGKRLTVGVEQLEKAFATGLLPVINDIQTKLTAFITDPKTLSAIKDIGQTLSSVFTSDNIDTVIAGMKDAGAAISGALTLFNSLPPEVKALAIGAFAINKVTGGAVTGIAGALGKIVSGGIGKIFATNVTVIGANVTGGGSIPGVGGAAGEGAGVAEGAAAVGGGIALGTVAAAAVSALAAAGIFVALYSSMQQHPDIVNPGDVFTRGHGFGRPQSPGLGPVGTASNDRPVGEHAAEQIGKAGKDATDKHKQVTQQGFNSLGGIERTGSSSITGATQTGAQRIVAMLSQIGRQTTIVNVNVTAGAVTKSTTVQSRYGNPNGSRGQDTRQLGTR